MRGRGATLLLVVIASVAACSDDDGAAPPDEVTTTVRTTTPVRTTAALVAQPTIPEVAPGPACAEAMSAAADETDLDRHELLLAETLDACSNLAQWFAALRMYPGAFGLRSAEFVSSLEVRVACESYPDSVVCRDAVAQGWTLTGPIFATP